MNNVVVSLDIGSSKISVVIAEINKKQFNIIGVGTSECKGVKKGVIVDIDATVEAIRNSVEMAQQMSNIQVKSAFVNIKGGYTTVIDSKGVVAVSREDKEITQEDVNRVIQAAKVVALPPDKEIIDIIPKQFIIDGYDEIRDPIGMVGVRLEVDAKLISASTTNVQNIIRTVQKAGLSVDGIIIEPLGTSAIVLNEDEKELGVALVDIGAETMDISVFRKKKLIFSKVIPVGGNHITNDISVLCKVTFNDAEKIKRQYGVANSKLVKSEETIKINNIAGKGEKEIYLTDIAEIMEARISEMLYIIKNELEKNSLIGYLGAGIVITGGGLFNIRGIQETAQNHFELPVRFGYPNYIGVANPTYSASAGIAMYVLKQKRTSTVTAENKKTIKYKDSLNEETASTTEKEDDELKFGWLERIKEFFADFF
ncbi:Cell division protein FtsA [Caloramator mitchellensis]|uniref:Cell division protein FtsA n=1 Tax=Caloramator mitchellensis TaxID=908809 RepID=A0A0R3JZK7_CALMK|nr:cell division protein FtsA [Caloramator mitchellensis]KRQ86580.1 Cell division protein FtsA [Caloramator mitchellensis]